MNFKLGSKYVYAGDHLNQVIYTCETYGDDWGFSKHLSWTDSNGVKSYTHEDHFKDVQMIEVVDIPVHLGVL